MAASESPAGAGRMCPVCTKSTHGALTCHNCGARLSNSVVSTSVVAGIVLPQPSLVTNFQPPQPPPQQAPSPQQAPPSPQQLSPAPVPGIRLPPPSGRPESLSVLETEDPANEVSFKKKSRVSPPHLILLGAFFFLLLGILLAFEYSNDRRTDAVIGFIAIMAAAILICLCKLRRVIPSPNEIHSNTCNQIGFKSCHLCCIRQCSISRCLVFVVPFLLTSILVGCGLLSVFVRHGAYIRNNRWYFLMEIIFASILPAIPLALISWNRGGKSKQLMLEAGLITSELGGLHVVLELSGIYARLFDHNTRVSLVLEHDIINNETAILQQIRRQVLEPIHEGQSVENFLMYPLLVAIALTIVSILLTFLRRATCRDPRKPRSQEKLQNYSEIGSRMKIMLALNVFLCIIISTTLGFGLRYDKHALADTWSDWVLGVIMCAVAAIVILIAIVAMTTRFGGFVDVAPWSYASELTLTCLLTMSPLAYIAFNRGSNHSAIIFQLLVLTGAICGIHVLLELSGTYAVIFHGRYRKHNVLPLARQGAERKDADEVLLARGRCARFAQRITAAHRVLIFVLICLLCGLFAASALPEQSTKTNVIVGFVAVIFCVVVICLFDLQMAYIEPAQARTGACKNIGFKVCRCACVKNLSLQWLITTSLVAALGGFLVLTGSMAAYIRYGTYIRDQFWEFLVECCMMSILTAIPVALISWNRGGERKELLVEVFLITGKFGGLHIMLELSGVYEAAFEGGERYSLISQNWLEKNETDIYTLVQAQILENQGELSGANESIFLVFLAAFFTISALAVAFAFLRRRCCRDPNKPRSQEKLHAYWALGVRMKAMLALSIVLCALILPELILGLRTDEEFAATCADLAAIWSELALYAILLALVLSVIMTSVAAVTTRYGGFIQMSPWSFVAELGVVVLLSITPMGYLAYNRGQNHLEIGLEMGILALKFGGLHLLLELSGYYATGLGDKYRNDLITDLPKSDACTLQEPITPRDPPTLPSPSETLGIEKL